MYKNKILLLLLIVFACNTKNVQKVVLTIGVSMNPNEPRIGIEIDGNNIYYCREKINKKGDYDYFHGTLNQEELKKLDFNIGESFKNKIELENIVDATPYQLNFNLNETPEKRKFYLSNLEGKQLKIIEKIIEMKNVKLTRIEYHKFPNDLLQEKLPEPPTPKNM